MAFAAPGWKTALILQPLLRLVGCQQFERYRVPYETITTLSQECLGVLNTTVSCDNVLATSTTFNPPIAQVLRPDLLNRICTGKCRSDLADLRSNIVSTCKPTDVMVLDGQTFPATFAIDHYLYTYDVSCYRDKTNGKLCDLYLGEMRNQSKQPDICSDCMLGVFAVQLNSPVGYSDDLASQFSVAKTKCSATAYTYTRSIYSSVTTARALGSTTPTRTTGPSASPTCTRPYTVGRGDTCNSIAMRQRASTYGIIEMNGFNVWCGDLKPPGTRICLPESCTPHSINPADTCESLAQKYGTTIENIMAWNPFFSGGCRNIKTWLDYVICVGQGNATATTTSSMLTAANSTATSSRTTSASAPSFTIPPLQAKKPHAPGSTESCTLWKDGADEESEDGFSLEGLNKCLMVASLSEIPLADLLAWNPSLPREVRQCELISEYSYCVGAPRGA